MGIEGLNPVQRAKVEAYAKENNITVEQAQKELMFDFPQEDPVDGYNGGQLKPAFVKPKKEGLGANGWAAIAFGAGAVVAAVASAPLVAAAAGVIALACACGKIPDPIPVNQTGNQSVEVNIDYKNDSVAELIDKYMKQQQIQFDTIIAKLDENNRSLTDILAVLTGLGAKVDKVISLIVDNSTVLEKISKGNQDIKELLAMIAAKVDEGNEIGTNNGALLKAILEKLSVLGDSDKVKIDLLKQILAKVTEDVENDKDANAQTKDLLMQILAKIDTMNANQQVFFKAILDRIDKVGENGKAALEAVLNAIQNNTSTITAAIEGLGDKGKAALEGIIQAINANTEVAKGSQEILVEILAHLDKLGGKADHIIELLEKIVAGGGGGGTVDLSGVIKLLEKILAQEEANGEVLVSIDNKIKAFRASLEAKLETATGEFKALLEAILAKIPPEHQCDHSTIIEILLEIKGAIGNKNHEGILDDLDDLFG